MVVSYEKWDAWERSVKVEEEKPWLPEFPPPQDESSSAFEDAAWEGDVPPIGARVTIQGLTTATRYNGERGIVVSGKICGGHRLAVEVKGKKLQVRMENVLDDSEGEALIGWRVLLEDRASLVFEGEGGAKIWIGDCFAASLCHGERLSRVFENTDDLDACYLRHHWIKPHFSLCCASEMPSCQLKLTDSLDERPDEKWNKQLENMDARVRGGKRILIYCVEGRSRSVTVALAVLVRQKIPIDEAWHMVKSARQKAKPNVAFACILLRLYYDDKATKTPLGDLARSMELTFEKVRRFRSRHVKFAESKLKTFVDDKLLPSLSS